MPFADVTQFISLVFQDVRPATCRGGQFDMIRCIIRITVTRNLAADRIPACHQHSTGGRRYRIAADRIRKMYAFGS